MAWPNARNISTQHLPALLHDVATSVERGGQTHGIFIIFKVAPYGYSLFVLRALVSTILGNLPITLSCTSLEPIEIKFWEIKLPF